MIDTDKADSEYIFKRANREQTGTSDFLSR